MTYSAAQQHLLQRLGITQLQVTMQFSGAYSVSSSPLADNQAPNSSPLAHLENWQLMSSGTLREDILRAVASSALELNVTQVWCHPDCASPRLQEQQLYLRAPLDALSKRELWHYLSQLELS